MRGASALKDFLKQIGDPRILVLIVWEPVIWSDEGPPTSSVQALAVEKRSMQFWDEKRALSELLVQESIYVPSLLDPGASVAPGVVVWDLVVVFPPGAAWRSHARPSYFGGPVIHVMDEVRSALGAPAP